MLTTRRQDGLLVSRPMAFRHRDAGAKLWFFTNIETDKVNDIQHDPNVNLAFYKDRTSEWVSIAGKAELVQDRQKITELYSQDLKVLLLFLVEFVCNAQSSTYKCVECVR